MSPEPAWYNSLSRPDYLGLGQQEVGLDGKPHLAPPNPPWTRYWGNIVNAAIIKREELADGHTSDNSDLILVTDK